MLVFHDLQTSVATSKVLFLLFTSTLFKEQRLFALVASSPFFVLCCSQDHPPAGRERTVISHYPILCKLCCLCVMGEALNMQLN